MAASIPPASRKSSPPTSKEMDEELIKIGKEAVQEANLPNIAKPIIPMLGRLGYRTSYGQNVLRHSLEVAYLSQVIADELGLDGTIARRAGLLHDIGKAMDHEQEGGHPQIGMEFLSKFNEPEAVLNAAAGPPRRRPRDHALHAARHGRRRHQRQPPRRPPREPGALRQAPAGAGRPGHGLRRRPPGLRDPGRPRGPRDRRRQAGRRQDQRARSPATSPRRSKAR